MNNLFKTLITIGLMILMVVFAIHCGGGAQVKQMPDVEQMPGVERIDGATIEEVQKEKSLTGVGPFSTISIGDFKASEEIKKDYSFELSRFKEALLSYLKANKAFSNVYDGEKGSINVTGEILSMRVTSGAARIFGGIMAGASYMDIYVKITDSNGNLLKEKIIASYNNPYAATWAFGTSDRSIGSDMGEIISAYLIKVIPTNKTAGLELVKVIEKKAKKKEEAAFKIGDRGPAGGWIFYDKGSYSDGWRYLEAAPQDQSDGIQWYSGKFIETGAVGRGIGTGKLNTQKIIKDQGEGDYAAKICADYMGGGENDWFLPSIDELNLMYTNLKKNGVGGFADYVYWSSSEYENDAGYAWYQYFYYSGQSYYSKNDTYYVRAVRAF